MRDIYESANSTGDPDALVRQVEMSLREAKAYRELREWARAELQRYTPAQQKALYDEIHEQRHGED